MTKKPYDKRPLLFTEQLQKLKDKGLEVPDETQAISYLQQISYYRLSAYFPPYQSIKDTFNEGTNFHQIIQTYAFDRELRLLVFDCIERIEVAIRTQFIYQMATQYRSSHWQDDKNIFVKPFKNSVGYIVDPYSDFQNIIYKAKTHTKPEVFIKHYTDCYNTPSNPPSWMCFELLTIGELSSLFRGLRQNDDKKRIASFFKLHPTVFQSWLHSLTYVRNICAHHSRLWNRDLAVEPIILRKVTLPWIGTRYNNNKRTFYFICILKYLLHSANDNNSLTNELNELFSKYPTVPIQYLGIPSDGKGSLLDWSLEPLFTT